MKHYSVGLNTDDDYLEIDNSVITQSESLGMNGVRKIICNLEDKTIVVKRIINDEEIEEEHPIEHGKTVKLEDSGYTWKGDCSNGVPFGYGCLYAIRKVLLYEGFYAFGERVCSGVSYYTDSKDVEYSGSFFKDRMIGDGSYYTPSGTELVDGNVYSSVLDRSLTKNSGLHGGRRKTSSSIEYFVTSDSYGNKSDVCLTFEDFPKLKGISIGDKSYRKSDGLEISGCPQLRFVIIGENCFTRDEIDERAVTLSITDCPLLECIVIGDGSFLTSTEFNIRGRDRRELLH